MSSFRTTGRQIWTSTIPAGPIREQFIWTRPISDVSNCNLDRLKAAKASGISQSEALTFYQNNARLRFFADLAAIDVAWL